jgi:hypothetical protein
MRVFSLLAPALLLLAALPALAPAALACHPDPGPQRIEAGPVATLTVHASMGCSHLPPHGACVTVHWQAIPSMPTAVCGPRP